MAAEFIPKKGAEMFIKVVKEAVLEAIADMTVVGTQLSYLGVMGASPGHPERLLIRQLLSDNVITEQEIKAAIHKALLETGRVCYRQHMFNRRYPDHTFNPDAFGYAIAAGAFTSRELKKINFDHGDTAETFSQHYGISRGGRSLDQEVFDNLVAEEELSSHSVPSGTDFCEEHGECFDSH